MDKLKEYIKEWRAIIGIKPMNDVVFIEGFCTLLNGLETEDLSFYGDGAYFGKQVIIEYNNNYRYPDGDLRFEVAYSKEQIRVYTASHEGFWTPEYIRLCKGDEHFEKVKDTLYSNLIRLFGLND